MQVPVVGYHLTNTQANHYKFYTVLIAGNIVVTAWGRIGTQGQSKIQKLPSYDDAESIGLRQVYAKQSKGYEPQAKGVKFMVDDKVLAESASQDNTGPLTRAFFKAMNDPEFEGDKQAVAKHYDEFVAKAQSLLDSASTRNFEEVHNAFEELEVAWNAISDKHAEAEITVSFLRQTLAQRLMSGAL